MSFDAIKEYRQFLLMMDLDTMECIPWLDRLPEEIKADTIDELKIWCQKNQWDEVAQPAIAKGTPVGIVMTSGPPGTGKTELTLHMMAPYLSGFIENSTKQARRIHIRDKYAAHGKLDEAFAPREDEKEL